MKPHSQAISALFEGAQATPHLLDKSEWRFQNSHSLGLYLHIPFCERKCPYCDFNTYAGLESLFDATVTALCGEMERWVDVLDQRPLTTIFMGGGTPTILNDRQLGQLFETIHRCFTVAPSAEITSEANPGTVDRAKFRTLRQLGVNRLSLGVQSFQPSELAYLERIHDVTDVYQAVEAAHSVGFANLNLDFMFGLPNQPVDHWHNTLDQALALEPEHLSLYSLIVEPNTPLAHWVKSGQSQAPDDDVAAELYESAMQRLAAAGYFHYEVSNWAKSGPNLASQHNLLYWHNQEYLGIGPGAHSHLHLADPHGAEIDKRWGNRKAVPSYVKRIKAGDSVEEFHEVIAPRTGMGETMMLGLRLLDEGVAYASFAAQHHVDLREVFRAELARLQALGLITQHDDRVCLTRRGLMIGNQVFMEFVGN